MWERLEGILKGAVELNLKYTARLLNVSTDYLRDFNAVVSESGRTQPSPPPKPPAGPAPLLIVGKAGETSSAAFALSNSSGQSVAVKLLVQGELNESHVQLDPPELAMESGKSYVARIIVRFDERMELGRDYGGAVVVPGVSSESVPFVVRRLPGDPPPPAPPKKPRAAKRKPAAK